MPAVLEDVYTSDDGQAAGGSPGVDDGGDRPVGGIKAAAAAPVLTVRGAEAAGKLKVFDKAADQAARAGKAGPRFIDVGPPR